jgi:hypothetical protein
MSCSWMLRPALHGLLLISSLVLCLPAAAEPPAKKEHMIAGTAEVLRAVPKRFARLIAVDVLHHRVTLLVEGESLPKVWDLVPDAEIKVAGWWGRLDQLKVGERVWAWFHLNRNKQPTGLLMLADEMSEQDVHGPGVTVQSQEGGVLTVKSVHGDSRRLKATEARVLRGKEAATLESLHDGEHVYVQSGGDQASLILDQAAFEAKRAEQKALLRTRWLEQGLPGTVLFLHISGEMEFMLDHEGRPWARALQPGDKVTLQTTTPIQAQVQGVRPWRERTQLRLVIAGSDQADLALGQRVGLRLAVPPEGESTGLPPDMDRPRSKPERIEWFLASMYCPCRIKGDGCTGHFYTLASCNPNTCGMPNQMRKRLAAKIDKGLTDRQIFDELLKEYGADLLKQHLAP